MEKENFDSTVVQSTPSPSGLKTTPGAIAVLILGISSIALTCGYGIGIVAGIIALVMAGKANKLYNENPTIYTEGSLKAIKTGKLCGTIGLILSAVWLIVIIFFYGMLFSHM